MRIGFLAAGAILALGMLGATAASAAPPANGADLLSGASVNCGDFVAMDASAQTDLIAKLDQPATSLTSNSGQSTTANKDSSNNPGMTTTSPELTAGAVVAACQAASPTSSLHDAFQQFSPSGNTTSNNVSK